MSEEYPDIRSVVIRVITNKPVRKTPYQVKGVFMRQYSDEPIIPMLDGSYRDRFLYPRVQVKILNEQIYIIGVHEGVDPVLSLSEKFKEFDFGNITFEVQDTDIEDVSQQFLPSSRLVRYRFITPWVALNHMTGGRYRFLTNQEKPSFLNRLLGQNIIFLANELGVKIEDEIFTKVKLSSLFPRPVDENKWGAFMGEFKTNFVLPNYIGVGNGITRGFGTIYGMFNPDSFSFDEQELKQNVLDKTSSETTENFDDLDSISASDVPKPSRRRRSKNKSKSLRSRGPKKKRSNNSRHPHKKHNVKNDRKKPHHPRSGRIFAEEFDIEDESPKKQHRVSEANREDEKFNTEKHHKQQHKF